MADDYLTKTLKTAYGFVMCDQYEIQCSTGQEEMLNMIMNCLCNHVGDAEFCKFLEEREGD